MKEEVGVAEADAFPQSAEIAITLHLMQLRKPTMM